MRTNEPKCDADRKYECCSGALLQLASATLLCDEQVSPAQCLHRKPCEHGTGWWPHEGPPPPQDVQMACDTPASAKRPGFGGISAFRTNCHCSWPGDRQWLRLYCNVKFIITGHTFPTFSEIFWSAYVFLRMRSRSLGCTIVPQTKVMCSEKPTRTGPNLPEDRTKYQKYKTVEEIWENSAQRPTVSLSLCDPNALPTMRQEWLFTSGIVSKSPLLNTSWPCDEISHTPLSNPCWSRFSVKIKSFPRVPFAYSCSTTHLLTESTVGCSTQSLNIFWVTHSPKSCSPFPPPQSCFKHRNLCFCMRAIWRKLQARTSQQVSFPCWWAVTSLLRSTQ